MKKTPFSLLILFFAAFTALGQSVTITSTTDKQLTSTTAGAAIPNIIGQRLNGISAAPTAIQFLTTPLNTTSPLERMRIDHSGNVGIGTTSPNATLEVNGFSKLGADAPAIKVKKLTGTENT